MEPAERHSTWRVHGPQLPTTALVARGAQGVLAGPVLSCCGPGGGAEAPQVVRCCEDGAVVHVAGRVDPVDDTGEGMWRASWELMWSVG